MFHDFIDISRKLRLLAGYVVRLTGCCSVFAVESRSMVARFIYLPVL
jgi:hypothetical protein